MSKVGIPNLLNRYELANILIGNSLIDNNCDFYTLPTNTYLLEPTMSRPHAFTVLSIALCLAFISTSVQAAVPNVGESCTIQQLGTTQMTADATRIIACLKNTVDQNTYTWKSFIGSNDRNSTECYTIGYKSPTVIEFSDTPTYKISVSDVIDAKYYASTDLLKADYPHYSSSDEFVAPYTGLKCINGYYRTACSMSIKSDGDIAMVDNGCVTDNEETQILSDSKPESAFYISCCR